MNGPAVTRRGFLGTAIVGGLFFRPATGQAAPQVPRPASASKWTLWYREPAQHWVEALPVGTGRLGAMVHGGTATEHLQLNEDTFWAGSPYDPTHEDALPALDEVRALIAAERYAEAQALANARLMARPLKQMPYQTLGTLRLALADGGASVSDYRRWLDLETGEAVTEWTAGARRHRRSVIASAVDQVILVRQSVDTGEVGLILSHDQGEGLDDAGTWWARGKNKSSDGIEGQLRFALAATPLGEHVTLREDSGRLSLRAENEVALVLAAATNYRDWTDISGDPDARVRETLAAVKTRSPDSIVAAQRSDHRQAFGGFDIHLGEDPMPETATSDRIRFSHDAGRDDHFLPALYVQYARYLLLASSQPGSQPANLQGIWNDSDTPPWESKYTININTQMNYWPAQPLGLAECVEPLIAMVEGLAISGRRTARRHYGARGWVAHHNTDLWRASAPIDGAFWGLWPMGGAWLCLHLWDHWDYSRDPAVLERIYPTIRDAGLFFLDTLVELPDGRGLVTSPSLSPENAHRPGVSICAGPACDRQILRHLFGRIVEASRLLGRDEDLRGQFTAAARRLPPDRVGAAGQLQEWLEDWDMQAPEIQHRHVSHLFAVHPGDEIGPETPDLYEAARRSLAIRGDDATGWGIGWRINLWARLGEAERAHGVLRKLLGPDRTYPNMFDAHPPFQIDGNFGGAAGVVEMLVRDRPQELELLPALPARAWPNGYVRGIRLRGALSLDLEWREGELALAQLSATHPARRQIRYGAGVTTIELEGGQTISLSPDNFPGMAAPAASM